MAKNNQPTGYYDPQTGALVQFAKPKKKKWPWIVGVIVVLWLIGITTGNKSEPAETEKASETEVTEAEPEEETEAEPEEVPAAEPETEAVEQAKEKTSSGGWLSALFGSGEKKEEEPEDPNHVKSGTYTIGGVKLYYTDHVRNDTTGYWRIATCADMTPPADIAREISETLKQQKGDVLWIVNFTLKTTTRINHFGSYLEVATLEYVDGEEHDAKILGGGDLYTDEQIWLTEAAP